LKTTDRQKITTLLQELGLLCIVMLAAWWVFAQSSVITSFHGDETHYLRSSKYFSRLFLERDLTHADWGESYVTRTQPMLARYVIGAWISLNGQDPLSVPLQQDYDFHLTQGENIDLGAVPTADLLSLARTPMVAFAVGTVGMVYLLARLVTSPIGGIAAATLLLGNSLAQTYLVRAAPDSMMIFFLLLALTVSVVGARRSDGGIGAGWSIVLGIALGLALATKLAALMGVLSTVVWSAVAATLAGGLSPGLRPRQRAMRAWCAARGWLLAAGISIHVLLLSNPYFYPAPGVNLARMFVQLAYENEIVQRHFPDGVIPTPIRAWYVLGGSLIDNTFAGRLGLPIELLLAAIGATALLIQTWVLWCRTRQIRARGLILVTGLTYFFAISTAISMAWQRYLIPTVVLSTLLSGIGIYWIVRCIQAGLTLIHDSRSASSHEANRRFQSAVATKSPPTR
jgi:hypothetical protein